MSRAYCLTCNEQVMVTASGTCTAGHPVTTHDAGPEPWVGQASTDDDVVERRSEPSKVERRSEPSEVDVAELEQLHHVGAGVGSVNGNGHAAGANGHGANGHGTNGRAPTGYSGNGDADRASSTPMTRHPANSQVSDDLSAMLAEALNSDGPEASSPEDAEAAATAPEASAPRTTVQDSEDWGDLATLAAELELDGSSAQAEVDEATSPEPSPPEPVQPPPPPPAPEQAVPPPPAPPAVPETDLWADEPTVTPPSDEDLPSEPWTDDGSQDVPADTSDAESTSRSSVDPTNFTARGARVGGGSARRLFGRKK